MPPAHQRGLKARFIHGTRARHIDSGALALRSLGDEIFTRRGRRQRLLQEHLISDTAGLAPDAARWRGGRRYRHHGTFRWHNYYLEGLRYLLKHAESTVCTWTESATTARS